MFQMLQGRRLKAASSLQLCTPRRQPAFDVEASGFSVLSSFGLVPRWLTEHDYWTAKGRDY